MPVIVIGTLDTKGTEVGFVCHQLLRAGLEVLVIDAGVLQPPTFEADIKRDKVFAAAGTTAAALAKAQDRGQAIEAAARGVTEIVQELDAKDKVQGVIGLGGSAGTTIATAAMRALPFGIPKLMVSTLASGQVKPYVGVRDIMMMPSVVDISGLNRISEMVLANAAQAMVGMCSPRRPTLEAVANRPLITATMFGVTTPCVEAGRKLLEAAGFEVLVFHATGTGGMTMESFIRDGLIAGVFDITTTELADELVGGVLSAGKDRLTAAALAGIPQVISVGALDMVNFGPPETVPEKFKGRRFYQHNPTVTLMRTTPEENDQLGKEIAEKASAAKGPTAVLLPLKGVSAIDAEGKPFWWPEADAALFQSIRNWISPGVQLIELDLHINDPGFARVAAEKLIEMARIRL
jgi:uncharacterized protein (UPF0261 family)